MVSLREERRKDMLPKRVRQFIMNLTDRIDEDDYRYVRSKLDDREYEIFNSISKSEQKHSVRVAREIESVIDEINKGNQFEVGYTLTNGEILDRDIILSVSDEIVGNKEMLVKAGLLHDVGKSRQRINIIDKSIIVILNKLTSGKLRNINLKKIQCYYNHSEYSYEILKKINESEYFLEIVRNHHNEDYTNEKCEFDEYYLGNIIRFFQGIDDGN